LVHTLALNLKLSYLNCVVNLRFLVVLICKHIWVKLTKLYCKFWFVYILVCYFIWERLISTVLVDITILDRGKHYANYSFQKLVPQNYPECDCVSSPVFLYIIYLYIRNCIIIEYALFKVIECVTVWFTGVQYTFLYAQHVILMFVSIVLLTQEPTLYHIVTSQCYTNVSNCCQMKTHITAWQCKRSEYNHECFITCSKHCEHAAISCACGHMYDLDHYVIAFISVLNI